MNILTVILWWIVIELAITVGCAIFIATIYIGLRLIGKFIKGRDFELPWDW